MNGSSAIWLDDDEMAALGLDSWSNTGWARDTLIAFANKLSDEARAIEDEMRLTVARQHGRRAFEPWMQAHLERDLAQHAKLAVIRRVLPLADEAIRSGQPLVYEFD